MRIDINEMYFEVPDNLIVSGSEFEDLQKVIYNCLKAIIDTDNIRIVVLETWMISEYFVRLSLAQAYQISGYKCSDIDPLYDLLPNSFHACIVMFEKLLSSQRKLPINEEDKRYTFSGSVPLIYHMTKNYPDVMQRVCEIEEEYNISQGWKKRDLFSSINARTYFGPYQKENWVNSMEHIDKSWFDKIRKINEIRNSAAHKYDTSVIYKLMGYSGKTAFDKAKSYCLDLIYKMFSISITE